MAHQKDNRTQFVMSLILTGVLTVILVVICFCFGENGLISAIEEAMNQKQVPPYEEKTQEEILAEKRALLAEYRALLSSPYMVVVDKSTPAVAADRDALVEIEGVWLEREAAAQLSRFLTAAREAGITVKASEGFRTVEAQKTLYDEVVSSMVSAGHSETEARVLAGRQRAMPGYSEHHTGLAVDLYENGPVSASDMKQTAFYAFAKEHCAEYGFVISYSETNAVLTGYDEKPWHFRYVGGQEQAQYIMEKGITLAAYVSYLTNTAASLEAQIGA